MKLPGGGVGYSYPVSPGTGVDSVTVGTGLSGPVIVVGEDEFPCLQKNNSVSRHNSHT